MSRSCFRLLPHAFALSIALSSGLPAAALAESGCPLAAGIDRSAGDPSVRIQDDAFRAVEGKWLAETPIPADRHSAGGFDVLDERTQSQRRELVERLPAGADAAGAADATKIADLSASFLDGPRIDGMTGDQRFYMGFVQAWQEKDREEAVIAQVESDPDAPGEFRANGTLTNQPGFCAAFGTKPGDRMYTAPEKRVIIW